MSVERVIEEAIRVQVDRLQVKQILTGTVDEVGKTACRVLRDNAPALEDVRLNAITGDLSSFVTLFPARGSSVLVGVIENLRTEAVLLRCSEVERIEICIGDRKVRISKEGIVIDEGGNKGLVKLSELTQKLNAIEADINRLKATCAAFVPVPMDGGAAFKLALQPWAAQQLRITQESEIENKNVKH